MSPHSNVEHARRITACMVFPLLMTGCAVTPEQFVRERHTLRDDEICRAQINALKAGDRHFKGKLDEELHRRGVSPANCSIASRRSRKFAVSSTLSLLATPPGSLGGRRRSTALLALGNGGIGLMGPAGLDIG